MAFGFGVAFNFGRKIKKRKSEIQLANYESFDEHEHISASHKPEISLSGIYFSVLQRFTFTFACILQCKSTLHEIVFDIAFDIVHC